MAPDVPEALRRFDLTGRVAVVTGASSGLDRPLTRLEALRIVRTSSNHSRSFAYHLAQYAPTVAIQAKPRPAAPARSTRLTREYDGRIDNKRDRCYKFLEGLRSPGFV